MASIPNIIDTTASRPDQKHVTTACLHCRRRKIKCDAGFPSCSNCTLYAQECKYPQGQDKRKIPVRERLAATEAYVKQLEHALITHGIPLPNSDELSVGARRKTSIGSAQYPSTTEYSIQPDLILNSTPIAEPSTARVTPPAVDCASPLVNKLSGSLGSLQIAEDGQLRFYGATSNLHLLVRGARESIGTSPISSPADIQAVLDAAGVGNFVDIELEDHLIKLYFCWEDPSIHLVQEEVFYNERRQCKSQGIISSKLYSEVLVNAMCAVGASLTSRHCVELPESLVEFFSSRAKALLDVELDSPTLSTVQSLGILSGVESIRTLDARGWLYSGMAVRLATDLGLHLDTQDYIEAGILDEEEASVRKAVFWGVFIHERMWSLYLGRPVSLNDRAITVPAYTSSVQEPKYWQPYVDDFEDFQFPALPDPIEELHRYNATLCAKMTRIRETLYSDSVASSLKAQELHDFAASMRSELLTWHSGLPKSLHVNLSSVSAFYVPHVLQLHMQYHCVMILVNRPFFSANNSTLPDVAFSDPMVGRPACTDSARSISKLLQVYRRLFSFRRINIQAVHLIFTASLIHVLNACDATERSFKNQAWKDLEVCSQALTEMGKGYKNAVRALEVVNDIKQELLEATRESVKRNSLGGPPDHNHRNAKRQRRTLWDKEAEQDTEDINVSETDSILDPTANVVDSIFWSEFTSLDFPGL